MTMRMRAAAAPLFGLAMALGLASGAAAQVDRYEFLQMKKQLEEMQAELGRLRGVIAAGGGIAAVEDELKRLVGQVERLEFAQRQHEAATKQKMLDLEYRIIELEGGDPSILFQEETSPAPAPARAPAAAPTQQGGGVLGVLTSRADVSGAERADFDAALAAAQSGDSRVARAAFERFLTDHPGSALAPEAHYRLGEVHFTAGEYRAAAERFIDGAELNPAAPTAPESLLKLGITLGLLGNREVGCATLREVPSRYPQAAEQIARAAREAGRAGCG